MELSGTDEAITYFLKHVNPTSNTGTSNTGLRERANRFLQDVANIYWRPRWKFKEKSAALSFNASGVASMPADFGSWDRDFGLIVWASPHFRTINPTRQPPLDVMTARTQYPTRRGAPLAVVVHDRTIYRWPTVPNTAPEAATAFYHRRRPDLLDGDPEDEWAEIPVEDQDLLMEGLRMAWAKTSGDGRQPVWQKDFRKLIGDAFRSRALDQQPRNFGGGFRAPGSRVPYVRIPWNS